MQKANSLYILLLIICLPITFVADIIFGSVHIPIDVFFDILQNAEVKESSKAIITELRLPRAIVALLTGLALPIAGLMMQTFFRNPLAGPYVLGVSTGASLGVAIFSLSSGFGAAAIISGLGLSASWGLIIAAFSGAFLVMMGIVAIAPKVQDNSSLLIIGMMLGSVTSAVVSILQYFSNPQEIHAFILWTFGSFSGLKWNEISIMATIIIPALLLSFSMQKPLDALLLGENYARGLGVNIKKLRYGILISASLLAGIITAFTGPIAFVGIAVPHIARMIFKTTSHKTLIVGSALIGANLVLICDLLSQMPGMQTTLPINTVTAIFGAPIVILTILKSRNSRTQI